MLLGPAAPATERMQGWKATNAYSTGPDIPTFHSPKGDNYTYMVNHFE